MDLNNMICQGEFDSGINWGHRNSVKKQINNQMEKEAGMVWLDATRN